MDKKRLMCGSSSPISPLFPTKKAQITLFIILGLVLLLAVVLFILIRQEIISIKPGELIPTEKGKVQNFITACLEQSGQEALALVGLQGGYVQLPNSITRDANAHVRLSPSLAVPYWAEGSTIRVPPLTTIKDQIDTYIEQNVRSCLFALQPFQETYEIVEKSQPQANTEITANKVTFNLGWDIEIRTKDGEVISELQQHQAESPVKLKRVYDLAAAIIDQEMAAFKLEDLTQDLISLDHPDVPLAGMELRCSRKEWNVFVARERVQDLLRINLRQLTVKGTDFSTFPEEFPYYQNHYVWSLGDTLDTAKMSVVFQYDPRFPTTFQVTPSSGNTLRSSSLGGSGLLSNLCIQTWKFTYDIIYPVVVRVRDETTGYEFNIALTVHLVRNLPNREAPLTARPDNDLDFGVDSRFCNDRRIPMTVQTWEKVELAEQGISSLEPLPDVNLTFTCLTALCPAGTTTMNVAEKGYQASISKNFPYCVGGILRGTKPGYLEQWTRVVTSPGEVVQLQLSPLLSFPLKNVRVLKHEKTLVAFNSGIPITKNDLALIRLTHQWPDNTTYTREYVLGGPIDDELLDQGTVEFLAGADFTYTVDITLFSNDEFVGGYKYNWTPSSAQLETAEQILFHTVADVDASQEERFQLLANLEHVSAQVQEPEVR